MYIVYYSSTRSYRFRIRSIRSNTVGVPIGIQRPSISTFEIKQDVVWLLCNTNGVGKAQLPVCRIAVSVWPIPGQIGSGPAKGRIARASGVYIFYFNDDVLEHHFAFGPFPLGYLSSIKRYEFPLLLFPHRNICSF
jgi:hypothetical protein